MHIFREATKTRLRALVLAAICLLILSAAPALAGNNGHFTGAQQPAADEPAVDQPPAEEGQVGEEADSATPGG